VNENQNRWLLQFSRPNSAAIEQIGELARTLIPAKNIGSNQNRIGTAAIERIFELVEDFVPGMARPWKRKEKDAAAQGDLAHILKKIEDDLELDYRENLAQSGSDAIKFDYVVEVDSEDACQLLILTRLYHPERFGNLFYGSVVRRTLDDKYLFWTDR
jgi:hypothetical protein